MVTWEVVHVGVVTRGGSGCGYMGGSGCGYMGGSGVVTWGGSGWMW